MHAPLLLYQVQHEPNKDPPPGTIIASRMPIKHNRDQFVL